MVLFKSKISHILISCSSVFTFHYGSIQIINELRIKDLLWDLHSTMVLFKWHWMLQSLRIFYYLHSTMVLFKFQRAIVKIALKRFTFHYGSIQMFVLMILLVLIVIYIPLWFYSNLNPFSFNVIYTFNLHSTMVLFKSISISNSC